MYQVTYRYGFGGSSIRGVPDATIRYARAWETLEQAEADFERCCEWAARQPSTNEIATNIAFPRDHGFIKVCRFTTGVRQPVTPRLADGSYGDVQMQPAGIPSSVELREVDW